jgi:hypothetical protein
MRTIKKLTGAVMMAGMVAGALVVSVAPASAEPNGVMPDLSVKACSAIMSAASSAPDGSVQEAVLLGIFDRFCR